MNSPAGFAVRRFVGKVRALPGDGRPSAIFKHAVDGPLRFGSEGCEGDEQADRRVHGGPEKAVHVFPDAHYAVFRQRFPEAADRLLPGSIGENLSVSGLDERSVRLGDVLTLGPVRLEVCQPRQPCWKIDARYGVDGLTALIAERGLTGWYCRVIAEGTSAEGDRLAITGSDPDAPTLDDFWRLWQEHRPDFARLAQFAACPALAAGWRSKLAERLDWLTRQAPT